MDVVVCFCVELAVNGSNHEEIAKQAASQFWQDVRAGNVGGSVKVYINGLCKEVLSDGSVSDCDD